MSIIRDGFQSADLDVPVVLPTLNLDFANSQELDPRITFSRGSVGTFVNKNGLISIASTNQPRFDYDPVTGECKGLLIEESRQNIALQSENINTSPWSTSTLTFATNSIVAPDGNTTADKLIENPSFSSFKTTAQSVGTISGTYTVSGFFKAGERFRGYLQLFGAGGNSTVIFNLRTGTITGGAGTNTITSYGNGWYRVTSTAVFTSAAASIYIVVQNDSGTAAYTGDGTSGLYCWGVQVEQGAFPTSYIPTSGSTVTRSADNADMTGTNFSSWYNQTESTIFCEFNAYNLMNAYTGVFRIQGPEPSGLNRIEMLLAGFGNPTSQPVYHNLYQNGINPNYADYFGLAYTTGQTKNIMRYKDLSTFVASKDGNIRRNTSRFQTIPLTKTMDSLRIGRVTNYLNGAISRFVYYPKALNDAEIQYLTQ